VANGKKQVRIQTMKKIIYLATSACLVGSSAQAQTIKTHSDSASYALGMTIAESIKKSGIVEYDEAIMMKAIEDVLHGKGQLTPVDADKIYRAEVKKQKELIGQKNKKTGEEFLLANGKKSGVKTTASGLQYEVVKEGSGDHPDANDKVTVHYHGTLIDGTVFDSSVDRGQNISFELNRVIAGWTEGVQLMTPGSKYRFYIPYNLAYGANGQGKIGAYAMLIFDIELFSFEKK
jgi:FKBP-type peptidyl-prolyl cis-trans isomerase